MSDNHERKALLTTGDIAEACKVSVRTVQYYDERGLLSPTARSEGGRRLYDEAALQRLQTICLLKSLGLPLKAIREILESDSNPAALRCLLVEQEKALEQDLEAQRHMLEAVRRELAHLGERPAGLAEGESRQAHEDHQPHPDMDHGMTTWMAEKGTRLRNTQRKMIIEGIAVGMVQWACIIGGVMTGNWWPLVAALPLIVIITGELVWMYHRDARYVCPHCHTAFQPKWREFFWAMHTPKTRKLTCPACGTKDWCAEKAAETPR